MKQRLIGAIVLGCLAIIFLPILLDGEGVSPSQMNATIPTPPPFPEPLEIEAQRPVILSDSFLETDLETDLETEAVESETELTEEAVITEASSPEEDIEAAAPALNEAGLPEAWSVRLGLFAEAANAENLVTRLINQNYRAYSETISRAEGNLSAVFVGPVLTRAEAQALRTDLAENFELDGLIVDFSIDSN